MNTYNAQNPSEMLHLLFDGELENTMETPLYASLMQNEELRSELRELIAIRESIRKDVEAYTPPVSATQGIFNKLGYTPPIIPRGAGKVPLGFMGLVKQKLWNPAVTAVLASFITALLFWNFYGSDEIKAGTNQFASANKNKTFEANAIPKVIIGMENQSANKIETPQAESNAIFKERIKYVYITKEDNKAESVTVKEVKSAETTEKTMESAELIGEDSKSWLSMASPVSFFVFDNGSLQPIQLSPGNLNQREFVLANNFYPSTEKGHSLLFQLKAMSGTSFPNVEFDNPTGDMFKNFSFGAFVPITENIHFGIEGGQEPFSQVFHHIENNRVYLVEQSPTLWWLGFGFKVNLQEKIEYLANAQPFLNLTLASTKVGPYGKAIAGLQFISNNGIGIMLGLEGSSLVYQDQKRFYSTEKLGITYGMFLKF